MAIRFYNSLTREIEEFQPIEPGIVTMYSCGPTVHDFVHIGNLRCYIFNDLLHRFLLFKGFKVRRAMNITDVDDKIIKKLLASGEEHRVFTERYTKAFIEDLETLNIIVPELLPRATDTIPEMVEMVEQLLQRGYAYRTPSGDIYFKIANFESYGQLANLDMQSLKENADGRLNADEYEKESAQDFALWKAYREQDGKVFWETSLGKGRPGWHLECSAMAKKALGETIDIHTGGVDLLFPHHTNEIAQSECCNGKPFVHYWMHNAHLIVDGKKMSKSLGNFYTLRQLLEKNLPPMAIRLEFLKTHYRQHLDFRLADMQGNQATLDKFQDFLERLNDAGASSDWSGLGSLISQMRASFEAALDDDLNIANAFAALYEFMGTINREFAKISLADAERVRACMSEINTVLGIMNFAPAQEVDQEIEDLIQDRERARAQRDFARSDQIRDQLLAMGIELKDTPQGIRWKRRS